MDNAIGTQVKTRRSNGIFLLLYLDFSLFYFEMYFAFLKPTTIGPFYSDLSNRGVHNCVFIDKIVTCLSFCPILSAMDDFNVVCTLSYIRGP